MKKMRWKAGDFIKVEKAVADFNKKITKLEQRGVEGLPSKISTEDVQAQIFTKESFKQVLSNLRRFSQKDVKIAMTTTDSGEKISEWELNTLKKEADIRSAQLQKDLQRYTTPNEQGFTRLQMGNLSALTIQANLKDVKNFQKLVGKEFSRVRKYIHRTGNESYTYRKAFVYRKNYMEVIKGFEKLDGYEELKKAFNEHSNPEEFYEWIEKTGDDNIIDIHYESDNTMTQSQFYKYLDALGVEYDKKDQVSKNEDEAK